MGLAKKLCHKGHCHDLTARLKDHNTGKSKNTSIIKREKIFSKVPLAGGLLES